MRRVEIYIDKDQNTNFDERGTTMADNLSYLDFQSFTKLLYESLVSG